MLIGQRYDSFRSCFGDETDMRVSQNASCCVSLQTRYHVRRVHDSQPVIRVAPLEGTCLCGGELACVDAGDGFPRLLAPSCNSFPVGGDEDACPENDSHRSRESSQHRGEVPPCCGGGPHIRGNSGGVVPHIQEVGGMFRESEFLPCPESVISELAVMPDLADDQPSSEGFGNLND